MGWQSSKSGVYCAALLAAVIILITPLDATAAKKDWHKLSFSYLGLGLEYLTYQEHLSDFYGHNLDTSYRVWMPTQRSGGYASINAHWGFAVTDDSTLFSKDKQETWSWNNIDIQRDLMAINRQETNVFAFRQLGDGSYINFGVKYSKYIFNRSDFSSTPGTTTFNSNNGTNLNPQGNSTINEESVAYSFAVGYGYDNYFKLDQHGLRDFARLMLASPIYRRVRNSSLDSEISGGAFKGVSLDVVVGAGWQFSPNFSINYVLEGGYTRYSEMTSGKSAVPRVTLMGLSSNLVAYWNF